MIVKIIWNREDTVKREDIPGRANVVDTPELLDYYRRLEALDAGALWTVANEIEPWYPKSTSVPTIWRYAQLRDLVLKSVELVTPEKAGRRVVMLTNPARREVSACVGWLYSGLQVMRPGEVATAHRHSASALRFIMEGKGAYTVVDGHRMTLEHRDFVLTPNGTWHQHGVDDNGDWCIWQDGLDIPLVNALEANFFQVHRDLMQQPTFAVDDSTATFGGPGLLPAGHRWDKGYSPLFKYGWDSTYESLQRYAKVTDSSPYDGILLEFVNPVTGGPVMQTIGAAMQMLRPGERTRAHRHTGSIIYQVARGSGWSIIDGRRFDWQERDVFCVPSWAVHEHANGAANDDACLFSFNDLPVIRALGLYREEAWADGGGHQPVVDDHH